MLFGDRIKQLRISSGLTQIELGKIIGVSDRVLGYYEVNERFPRTQEVISKFAQALNVSVDYLFSTDESFIKDTDETHTTVSHKQAQKALKILEMLFTGSKLVDEDKDDVFRMVTELYFDAKKKNKKKYGRNKNG